MILDHPKDRRFQWIPWHGTRDFTSHQLRTMRHCGTCSPSLPWSWKVWMMQEHWWSIDTGAQGVMRRCLHVPVWESKALDRFVFAFCMVELIVVSFWNEVLLAVPILEMCVVMYWHNTTRWIVPRLCRGDFTIGLHETESVALSCSLRCRIVSPMSFHSSTSTWHDTTQWILKRRDALNRHRYGHVICSYNSYSS